MRFFEVDLSHILKVTLLSKTHQTLSSRHVTRYTPDYIVYAVAGGTLYLEHNGEELTLSAGDIYIFNKDEFQRPLKASECEFYYLHFKTDALRVLDMTEAEFCNAVKQHKAKYVRSDIYGDGCYDHMKVLIKNKLHIADKTSFESVLSFFKANALSYDSNDPLRRLNISTAAAGFLMKLEDLSFDSLSGTPHGKGSKVYSTVERIADFIGEHYTENFGSAEIEQYLFINFDYANRIFKRHIGYSIIQYRNRLRINTAKTLVCNTPLDEVAFCLGFSDRYYFSKCFKRFEGVSPEEYRLRIKAAQNP